MVNAISLLIDEIEKAVHKKDSVYSSGNNTEFIPGLMQYCQHHLKNVKIFSVTKRLSSYLNITLSDDLSVIDFHYRVTTKMDAIK